MSRVRPENSAERNPNIMVNFASDAVATLQGFTGTEYESAGNNRGMHGSFGSSDGHNTLVAISPNVRSGFANTLLSGDVDVTPAVAAIFGVPLPGADDRVLSEALKGYDGQSYTVQTQTMTSASRTSGLTVTWPTGPDGKDVNPAVTSYGGSLLTGAATLLRLPAGRRRSAGRRNLACLCSSYPVGGSC